MTQPWQPPHHPNHPFGGSTPPASNPYLPQAAPPGVPGPPPAPGYAPLGQQPLPRNDIARYEPPRQQGPVLWVALGIVVLVAVVVLGLFLQRPGPPPVSEVTPSPTPGRTANLPGHPFTMPSNSAATGRWQIIAQQWTSEGVLLDVEVACDTEMCSYAFTSFAQNGATSVDPEPGPRSPALTKGILEAGESARGYVFLPLTRGTAMLVLTTSGGRPISALPITA